MNRLWVSGLILVLLTPFLVLLLMLAMPWSYALFAVLLIAYLLLVLAPDKLLLAINNIGVFNKHHNEAIAEVIGNLSFMVQTKKPHIIIAPISFCFAVDTLTGRGTIVLGERVLSELSPGEIRVMLAHHLLELKRGETFKRSLFSILMYFVFWPSRLRSKKAGANLSDGTLKSSNSLEFIYFFITLPVVNLLSKLLLNAEKTYELDRVIAKEIGERDDLIKAILKTSRFCEKEGGVDFCLRVTCFVSGGEFDQEMFKFFDWPSADSRYKRLTV